VHTIATMSADELYNLYIQIPTDASCEANKESQQLIMQACWMYGQLINENISCSVCKWKGNIKPAIVKYLKGCGKL
jgi:hypothetical protein